MKHTIKDMKPSVGIFSLVDGELYCLEAPIEDLAPINGMYDAGKLFHIDLLKQIPDMNPNLNEDLKKELKSVTHPYDYPRGRVCYNINNDQYLVFTCEEIARNEYYKQTIMRKFHLPVSKTVFYIDDFYKYR